ncbi:MAG: type II secretion system F family protein [Candidatus Staskawiczbacteria bacterium]|jgi:type IV pilus assembly protein PilC
MKFIYQARSQRGEIETGTIEASSQEAAAALLQKYNIFVTSLKEEKTPFDVFKGGIFKKKVSQKDLSIFSRQLAVMIDSRVPIIESLSSLASQTSKKVFREKIMIVSKLIEEGNTLSDALAACPETFGFFYISLIKSGEASGKISESLYHLSTYLERQHDIKSKIKGAMIYPAVVLSALVIVIAVVMTMVMPKLITILEDAGGDIPFSTKMLIGFYNLFAHYGLFLLIAAAGFIVFLIYYFKTKEGKKVLDVTLIKLPLVGGFLQKNYIVNFAENLSTLIMAGLPIVRALEITKDTINNYVYKGIIAETEKEVSEGEKISSVLVRYPNQVPPFIIQMIKVGEETGKLDKTLAEIVGFYKKEIEAIVDNFMTLIEPVLIVFLGVGVAILAISVLSPMYGMLNTV